MINTRSSTSSYIPTLDRLVLFHLEPPHFVRPMRSEVVVAIGDSVVLQCVASGAPVPSILWIKDGNVVVKSSHVVFAEAGQFLVIAKAKEEDSGNYACEAANSQGAVSQRTQLSVEKGMWLNLHRQIAMSAMLYLMPAKFVAIHRLGGAMTFLPKCENVEIGMQMHSNCKKFHSSLI